MRVLCLSRLFPNPAKPNFAAFNRQQFAALAERADVHVIAPIAMQERVRLKKKDLNQWCDHHHRNVSYPTYFYSPGVLRGHHGRMLARSIRATWRRVVARFKPDCVFATWAFPDVWAASQLAAADHLPVFAKVHGSDVHSISDPGVIHGALAGLKTCQQVFSVSNDLRAQLIDMGLPADRISTVYNGVDRDHFRPLSKSRCRSELGIEAGTLVLAFVGNLVPIKQVDQIINAFADVPVEDKLLLLTGSGPLQEALQQQANARGLAARFLGSQPHRKLPTIINAADALVLYSAREGVPNVLLEAMSCGTPVIAGRVGGVPEVVPECAGITVTPASAAELTQAMMKIADQTWEPDQVRSATERFSWQNNAEQLITCFEKAIP